jgi:hypothetical protein
LLLIGKGLLIILYTSGRMYTMMALTKGMAARIRRAIMTADHFPSIDRMEAPKYAKTNASEM